MIRTLSAGLIAVGLLLAGCSTTQLVISPLPANAMSEEPDVLEQEQTHRVSVELLTPTFSRKHDELPTFAITVDNRGQESLLISLSNVRLTSGGQPVQAYTLEEYTKLIQDAKLRESDQNSARQAEIAMQANSAQRTPELRDNSAAIAKISSAKMANSAAAKREAAMLIEKEIANLVDLDQINPGRSLRRLIKFHGEEIQADQALTLEVKLKGEVYTFDFEVSAIEK